MAGPERIPTDAEIREAARQLAAGGFNDKEPALAVYANQLVAEAGSRGGHVASQILSATAEFDGDADDEEDA